MLSINIIMRRKKIISMTMLMILTLTMARNCNDLHAGIVDSERKKIFMLIMTPTIMVMIIKPVTLKACVAHGMTQIVTKL